MSRHGLRDSLAGMRFGDQRGQASVELVAIVPLALAVGAIAWQLALAGHTAWLTAHAARAGARAAAVGEDPRAAARSALPAGLERGLKVERPGGAVRVEVRLPVLLHRWRSGMVVGATSALGEGSP